MRYAVLSDIHSNLEALTACLEALRPKGVESYVVCGDHVGYGPDPSAVLELLSKLPALHAVKGNHDLAALGEMDTSWFNSFARSAVQWTARSLSASMRKFLGGLPMTVETKDFTAVHGSPREPAEEYLLTKQQFLENLASFKVSPCFVGHSHLPLYFQLRVKDGQDEVEGEMFEGEGKWTVEALPCVLNPGSVGQPRDLDPRASCAVYDTKTKVFEVLRVPYPFETTQKKIIDAGLPKFLSDRLAQGR